MIDTTPVEFLDQVAQRLIKTNPDVRYAIAQSPAEIETIYRLRYRTVTEQGWSKSEDYPDGQERDEYDDEAIHIGCWQGATLLATIRLILPSARHPLPAETGYGIQIEPYQQVVECSRAIVAPEYRDRSHELFFGVLGRSWIESRARGFRELCGTMTERIIRIHEQGGFVMEILGEPHLYLGAVRYPVKFDIPRSVSKMQQMGLL
ncbi:MAG: GNAT family N-acetyltransferase [Anaerolineae bacterium]|nr:GNAT family N-acetyltransferase [Anaerolineae bacterium]